jgi:hypothetical protein
MVSGSIIVEPRHLVETQFARTHSDLNYDNLATATGQGTGMVLSESTTHANNTDGC